MDPVRVGFNDVIYAENLILRANLLFIEYVYGYMYGPLKTFESISISIEGII